MSVLTHSKISDATKCSPYAATKVDLQLMTAPFSTDPEIYNKDDPPALSNTLGLMLMAAIDTPLTFLADTMYLPWDIRNVDLNKPPPAVE